MKMKLLFENWRQYLTEVSFADAKEILDSKGTIKIIKNYESSGSDSKDLDYYNRRRGTEILHKEFKDWLLWAIPDDITDNQKGTAILWLRKLAKKDPEMAKDMITQTNKRFNFALLRSDFETFFHHQRFFPQQDLMQVKSIYDLHDMAEEAKEEIEAHRQTQLNSPEMVKEGTTFLRGDWSQEEELETVSDKGWAIMEITNKAASCFHGTADWCTAQKGLNYFEQYYKPDDPLFIFEGFWTDPTAKFQFHYGSDSFMDAEDRPVNKETFKKLHNLLMQTEAPEKYKVVQKKHYDTIAADSDTPAETLTDIIDELADHQLSVGTGWISSILQKVAKNAKTPLESLKKLYRSTHDKYIIRNIQVNPVIDFELAKEILMSNPKDPLIYSRGMDQMTNYKRWGISFLEVNKIINAVEAARNYEPRQIPREVANLYERIIKIRVKKNEISI